MGDDKIEIVERLKRSAELKRAAAMDCYGDRRDDLNREAAEDDQIALTIQSLVKALKPFARQDVEGMLSLEELNLDREDFRRARAEITKLRGGS